MLVSIRLRRIHAACEPSRTSQLHGQSVDQLVRYGNGIRWRDRRHDGLRGFANVPSQDLQAQFL